MEAALRNIGRKEKAHFDDGFSPDNVAAALSALVEALRHTVPLLQQQHSPSDPHSVVSAGWLLALCSKVQSELGTEWLAQSVVEASHLTTEQEQQTALYDTLGVSEASMEVLIEVAAHMTEIRQRIRLSDLVRRNDEQTDGGDNYNSSSVLVDQEEHRRRMLRQEALDAAQIAAITKDEAEALNPAPGATHSVTRTSGLRAQKIADKAAKRATQALKKAREAGAIIEDYELMAIDNSHMGEGGLMGMSQEQIWGMQQSLLPEGSRELYDQKGLPKDTTHEHEGNLERVVIPAAQRDESKLPPRLKIKDIMDSTAAIAFAGTTSLNPMQSTVFEIAFQTRINMLVCAPTGAGKTNVAMLTVVSHLQRVGLIGGGAGDKSDTGKKVVYIAPMKALAQEVVEKFSSMLKPLGIVVRELTGDMQLTRAAAEAANVIVTTPEKWDVVTRKSGTDENSLGNKCGLLIIDEVHLLADERGAVIESIVSRFHRLVESRQRQIRIVALSATLPNYADVAEFLQVPERGMFFFGGEYRPVPLQQQFIGLVMKSRDRNAKEQAMNDICFDEVLDSLKRGHQVMVFVHSRKGTGDTAQALADRASAEGVLEKYFVTQGKEGAVGEAQKRFADRVKKSRSRELGIHFDHGVGIHHAGMLRGDRKLTEQMFAGGAIRVLCCTATLAWGVNLPVHSVIIKGTEVYNPEKGGLVDLSILDVQQIFGRAGRPQFDTSGEATLITSHEALKRYLDKLVRAVPIESNFIKQLADHLNAEIVGGTVTNVREAAAWLKYTYLYVRMLRNPLAYGINADQKADDPQLNSRCVELVTDAAKRLDYNRMIRYGVDSGNLSVTNRGRVAAHFYIQTESVTTFNEMLSRSKSPTDADLARIVCSAEEFKNMKMRQEEESELESLAKTTCPLALKEPLADAENQSRVNDETDKCFVLLQAYISRRKINSFTLITDMNYLASNAARVARAIFEICIKEGQAGQALKLLRIAKSVDNQIWWFQTPLRHFDGELKSEVFAALESQANAEYDSFESAIALLDMHADEVGQLARWYKGGAKIQKLVRMLPKVEVQCMVQPVTSGVFKFHIELHPAFEWSQRWHGGAQSFWLWIEDGENDTVYHHEHIVFSKRTYPDPLMLDLSIPAFEPLPKHYFLRLVSDTWVAVEFLHPVSLRDIKMPNQKTPFTDLLDLTPLPTSALQDEKYEGLFTKFDTFNPIQTQLFYVLYHTDCPVFLGAPTGSGKTLVALLAILRMKRLHPKGVCVYIAPLKSLARERLKEWQKQLGSAPLHWSVLELSGDTHHGTRDLENADVLVCTPEKWDLISRGWKGDVDVKSLPDPRGFVKRARLLVIDEVHLLGEDRGAVLEAIVSRTRFISKFLEVSSSQQSSASGTEQRPEMTRIIGLSTAIANPIDLADWMGIDTKGHESVARRGLYNFRSSVRPVEMRVHVQGFSTKHYCPRMATMNKPCYAAIKDHSPEKPALIFVASRRQTRLTAFDIISYAAGDECPKRFLGCSEDYIESVAERISDEALRHTITFGIGLHHAGLSSYDRDVVERMFLSGEIRVLVATATLAWGVNLPAHLVIVKGTEYFDGKTSRYVDYPLTDVLQMIGRAGRPGFDTEGVAVVMAAEAKKNFYMKFLYSPFPVESCLRNRLCENLNAEIAIGTVNSIIDAVGYMTWTFFARRVKMNPSYYGAKSGDDENVELFLLNVVKETVEKLKEVGCTIASSDEVEASLSPTLLGRAATKFYLLCGTPKQMQLGVRHARKMVETSIENGDPNTLPATASAGQTGMIPFTRSVRTDEVSLAWLLYTLSSTHEFDELPVRHNEEFLNEELSDELMWGPDTQVLVSGDRRQHNPEVFEDPHTKCFLLLQAYLEHAKLPISDYINDTKSVIDNVPRLLAAMQFIAAGDGTTSGTFELICQFARSRQLLSTRSLPADDPLRQLPGFTNESVKLLIKHGSSKDGRHDSPIDSIRRLRSLPRKDAVLLLQKAFRGNKISIDKVLDRLYSIPTISIKETSMHHSVDKTTGQSHGTLKVSLEFQREEGPKRNGADSLTLVLVLGSLKQRMLLSASSTTISQRNGTWTVSKQLDFDWSVANADGGESAGHVILRLLWEEVRGFDAELHLSLK